MTYERIDDSKLKLQALAWSEDAARRMAVINDQIVHEGESVEDYQVIKIREEDVVIKGGGKSWRLEFGLQQ
jgi:type II secretory pathway component PulC